MYKLGDGGGGEGLQRKGESKKRESVGGWGVGSEEEMGVGVKVLVYFQGCQGSFLGEGGMGQDLRIVVVGGEVVLSE